MLSVQLGLIAYLLILVVQTFHHNQASILLEFLLPD